MGDFLERNIMSCHVMAFLRKQHHPGLGVGGLELKPLEGKRTKMSGLTEPSPGWESSSRAHSAGIGTNTSVPGGRCCWVSSAA